MRRGRLWSWVTADSMLEKGREESRNLVYLFIQPHTSLSTQNHGNLTVTESTTVWTSLWFFSKNYWSYFALKYNFPQWYFWWPWAAPYVTTAHSGCCICLSIWLWHLKGCDALRWCEVPEQLASTQVWGFLMRKSQHGITATTGKTAQCDAVGPGTGNGWRHFFTERHISVGHITET